MLNLLLFPIIILLFIILTVINIVWRVITGVFGTSKRENRQGNYTNQRGYSKSNRRREEGASYDTMPETNKVYGKDEGEYAEFEEIDNSST